MSDLTILVDADIVIYRACAACEREVKWDEFNHVLQSNEEEAWDAVESIMRGITNDVGSKLVAAALSGGGNFRKDLSPTYKRHRGRKPLAYTAIRERYEKAWRCNSVEGLEGDDLLGIWQTSGKLKAAGGDTIIWSIDKDMRGIPGKHWDVKSGTVVEVTDVMADYFWMTQVLTGDTADGYPGLPGCGPKTAEKLLCSSPTMDLKGLWTRVVEAYTAKGLGEEDALLQAQLARILRAEDWDSERKEVKLWKPSFDN